MISLIGMGSGCPESLTVQGLAALQSAGLILGAKRLLEHLPAGCTDNCKSVYKPEEILACLAAQPDTDTAILYSGDTGFYSGAAKLLPLLRVMGYSVRVLPGLSSVQLLAAAVGRPWQDWKLVSAHGRVCDPVAEVLSHPQVFFLTGGGDSPATLCSKLTAAGLGAAHALVGENLGTPAEAIRFGLARELAEDGYRLIATGEMGIGNTTTSSAVAAVLLGQPVELMTGRGAGLSDEGLARKVDAICRGILCNEPDPEDTLDVLAKLGGFDIAGLCGVFLGGALAGVPVLADGFISGVAALCAVRLCPAAAKAVFASHCSAEPAARIVLEALGKAPIITAGLHLGEGTGAVASIPLWDMALAVYGGCYSFAEGGIAPYTPQC